MADYEDDGDENEVGYVPPTGSLLISQKSGNFVYYLQWLPYQCP